MSSGKLLASSYLSVEKFVSRKDLIELHAVSRQPAPACPLCSTPSNRVQSRYTRTLADLPWHGVAVRIIIRVRRLFCDLPDCPRKIFAERLPDVAAPYARCTKRLADAIELIGFVLGGEAGARTAAKLGIYTSPDTLIRAVRRAPLPPVVTPRVLGVDDWAIRRGHRYGTILIDLETRRRVDVLADREGETLAAWLRQHPGIEIISRDRGGSYADGARTGAPSAIEVADRWHLLKNLGDAIERFLASHHEALIAVGKALTEQARADAAKLAGCEQSSTATPIQQQTRAELDRRARRGRRLQRYEKVIELAAAGIGRRAIARETGLSRATVKKYLSAGSFPEIAQRSGKSSLDIYKGYFKQRWEAGCRNATDLWREIKGQGYRGSAGMVRLAVRAWRNSSVENRGRQTDGVSIKPKQKVKAPSPRGAMWLLIGKMEKLSEEEMKVREKLLELCPEAEKATALARDFQEIVRGRKAEELTRWMREVKGSGIAELKGFVEGLGKDRKAVEAALSMNWSNGQVEGQVNRIKAIKRAMYGRAKFDLLRRKILLAG